MAGKSVSYKFKTKKVTLTLTGKGCRMHLKQTNKNLPTNCVITLKDIVDLINNGRDVTYGDKGHLEHGKSKKIVEKLSKIENFGTLEKISIVYNVKGQTIETFALNKKQAIACGARLDNTMLMQVINRVEELENLNRKAPALPDFSNPADAARAWAVEYEEKEKALALVVEKEKVIEKKEKVIEKKEKVIEEKDNFLKIIVHAKNTYSATEVAASLGVSPSFLNSVLVKTKTIRKVGGSYVLYSKYQGYQLTEVKESTPDDSGITSKTLKWTAKGKGWISSNWNMLVERSGLTPDTSSNDISMPKIEE